MYIATNPSCLLRSLPSYVSNSLSANQNKQTTRPKGVNKCTAMNFIKDLSVDKVLNLAEDTFNQVKPKTDVEARVYEVLSHKNWGSSSTVMNEVARDTYDHQRCEFLATLDGMFRTLVLVM